MGNQMPGSQNVGCIPSENNTTGMQIMRNPTEGVSTRQKKSSLANSTFVHSRQFKGDNKFVEKQKDSLNKSIKNLKLNNIEPSIQELRSSILGSKSPQEENNLGDTNGRIKQNHERLQKKDKVQLGNNFELICQFQAAEIERLNFLILEYQNTFFQIKKRNVDRSLGQYFKELQARLFSSQHKIKKDECLYQDQIKIQVSRQSLKMDQQKSLQNANYNLLYAQLAKLKAKILKLTIKYEQNRQSLQKANKQKDQLQAKLLQLKALLQKSNYNDSQRFKQYQQTIASKDLQIKRIRKRLKQRNLEIRALNYELQESQTNQYNALEDNQQLIFQLSKLNLPEESIRLKSELLSIRLKKSQLSKKKQEHQQFMKSKAEQNNLLSVPGISVQINHTSSRIRPPSSRIRPPSSRQGPPSSRQGPSSYRQVNHENQNSFEQNPFLRVIQELPHKSSSFKKNSGYMKTQHRQVNQIQNFKIADQPRQFYIKQSKNLTNFIQAMQIELRDKRMNTATNETNYLRTQSNLDQNCRNKNLDAKLVNGVGHYQIKTKRVVTVP